VELEMKIKGLMIDPITNMPIIILRDPTSSAVLPIWVGIFEANAIALQIEKIVTPRPMTHDLLKSMINGLQAKVEKIVITDLKENTISTGKGSFCRSTHDRATPSHSRCAPVRRSSSTPR
jgi:bifunctional DNase/RNase